MNETQTKQLIWIGGALGAFAFLFVAGAGAWYMAGARGSAAGDLSSAVTDGDDVEPEERYEPSSVWIKEGVDPDVTTFGFGGDKGQPAAQPGRPEVSEYDLQNAVYQKQNSLMTCYADALAENPDLQGKVDMQFGVAPDGRVVMVKVTGSSLEDKGTEDCLVAKSKDWAFAATNRDTLMKFDTDFTFVYE